MQGRSGFTLFEALTALAILAVLSAIAVPKILAWRNSARLIGACANLKGDLEMAKGRAIRENAFVAVKFFRDRYQVFVDNGASAGDYVCDPDEDLLQDRRLPAGVHIDLEQSTFAYGDPVNKDWRKSRFNGRGFPITGTAVVVNSRGDRQDIVVSALGRIRVVRK